MDVKEYRDLISLQLKMLKTRLEKIRPSLEGRSVEMFITFQPLKNINPNDPNDPIPWRSDPDAQLTPYERKLLAEQFQNARRVLEMSESTKGTWSPEEPAWKGLERTEAYASIPPWLLYCEKHMVIGTCTSKYKMESHQLPLVKRGTPGVLIDPKAVDLLTDEWKERMKKVPANNVMVIFNSHMYFLEPIRLNKLKYDMQNTLF